MVGDSFHFCCSCLHSAKKVRQCKLKARLELFPLLKLASTPFSFFERMEEEEYKIAKEAHVTDCTGGSIGEVGMVCASLVTSHMLWCALLKKNYIQADSFISQFVVYVIPILSCLTLAADYASSVTIGMALMALVVYWPTNTTTATTTKETSSVRSDYKPYLTVYRAGTMLSTCIAILAVDFQFFPRRFAKVETFGTSLMDAGVGSFVFSSGVVAARAYISNKPASSIVRSMLNSIRSAFPILVLGFARLFLTKSVNYQEHNSEYGLHWNFFFTLGFLPPFVTLIGFCRKVIPFSVLGFMIAIGYQFALCQGLQDWILNTPRVDLVSANKEGICSFLGYLSIFLFGLQCGVIIFQENISKSKLSQWLHLEDKQPVKQFAVQLYIYSAIMWSLFYTWIYLFPEYYVSRRMANLPYIFWVIAFNLSLVSSLVLVESKYNIQGRGPPLLDALNINGLFTFLLVTMATKKTVLVFCLLLRNILINIVFDRPMC
ncbi:unnamed protein product [Mucor hiemalis]